MNGNITTEYGEIRYSFPVTNGTTYRIWWDNKLQGSGSKSASITVSAIYSNGISIFSRTNSGWNTPKSFTANSDGTVYISVLGSTGTFGIGYSDGNLRPGVTPVLLIEKNWINGSIDAENGDEWYSLPVTSGEIYRIWLDGLDEGNNQGIHKKTLSITVDAIYNNGTEIFTSFVTGWNTPQSFTASSNGTVYIRVRPRVDYIGTYGIVYSTGSTRPDITLPSSQLTENQWISGNITVSNQEIWYSFPVTSGTTYNIWWDDSQQGRGNKTVWVEVSAIYSNVTSIFSRVNGGGWSTPRSFTANSNSIIYIRVTPVYSNYSGTYGLVYSKGSTRPAQ